MRRSTSPDTSSHVRPPPLKRKRRGKSKTWLTTGGGIWTSSQPQKGRRSTSESTIIRSRRTRQRARPPNSWTSASTESGAHEPSEHSKRIETAAPVGRVAEAQTEGQVDESPILP